MKEIDWFPFSSVVFVWNPNCTLQIKPPVKCLIAVSVHLYSSTQRPPPTTSSSLPQTCRLFFLLPFLCCFSNPLVLPPLSSFCLFHPFYHIYITLRILLSVVNCLSSPVFPLFFFSFLIFWCEPFPCHQSPSLAVSLSYLLPSEGLKTFLLHCLILVFVRYNIENNVNNLLIVT